MAGNEESYTQNGVMAQIWVAFGQGTGMTRISQKAALALHGRYYDRINASGALPVWGNQAVQVLERIRMIGKLAAAKALERGDTTISEDDVNDAIGAIESKSDTEYCPPK